MKEIWDPDLANSSTSPSRFKSQIQRFAPRFMGYSQQDSQEFLRYVLEGLHMEVNRVQKRPNPIKPNYEAEDCLPDNEKANLYWKRYLSMDNSEIVAVKWIMKTSASGGKYGMQWTVWMQLKDLDFTDDLALLSHTHQKMQVKTTGVTTASVLVGLNMYKGKPTSSNKTWRIPTQSHLMENSRYLGIVIDEQGGSDADLKARIAKSRAEFL
ncbi:unnamed protein product [Schistosoma curassoni]|uniref:ubiquitinyl hydrolase 1 n=1 Tax=Schistosoma curassoni TaxID=6186 RepID=A0A183K8B5_9TREM|nr:unnamed protein product [Schistosoma curassoni]